MSLMLVSASSKGRDSCSQSSTQGYAKKLTALGQEDVEQESDLFASPGESQPKAKAEPPVNTAAVELQTKILQRRHAIFQGTKQAIENFPTKPQKPQNQKQKTKVGSSLFKYNSSLAVSQKWL